MGVWLAHNWPWLVWPTLTAAFNVLVRFSDEDWARLERTRPRVKRFIEFLRDYGVHPKQLAVWLQAASAAKSAQLAASASIAPPPARDASIPPPPPDAA